MQRITQKLAQANGKGGRPHNRPHLERLCVSAVNSSRQLELLDLTGAAAYEAGIDTKANQARIMPPGLIQGGACGNGGRRRMLFNSRLAAGGIVSRCVV